VKKAIAAGAKLQTFNKYGQTPLHVALIYGSMKCALLLVYAGADLQAKQNQPPHSPVLDFCDDKKRAQLEAAARNRPVGSSVQ
jgi:ankyrin repeat protein